ncbi:MAG: hypothetical protein AAF664_05670 [Planctomycetota bacterium]
MKFVGILSMLLVLLVSSGCGSLVTTYGVSTGSAGQKSLNGFGTFRLAIKQEGFRTRDLNRLSHRTRVFDAMVWTPSELDTISQENTRWFDSWLRQGDRTLIYILPDSGSELDYWADLIDKAKPEQTVEYRRRIAQARNKELKWSLAREEIAGNGWFIVEPVVGDPKVELGVKPFSMAEHDAIVEAGVQGRFQFNPTGPASSGYWRQLPGEVGSSEIVFEAKGKLGELVRVAEISSPDWENSRVIVVGGGSQLTNYALSSEEGASLAADLISDLLERREQRVSGDPMADRNYPTVGFARTQYSDLPVSQYSGGTLKSPGLDVLTVWPLSLVTIHSLLLGLVVCLRLLPIFGRPKRLVLADTQDFAVHIDAVATMMQRGGGLLFARSRIQEFRRRFKNFGQTEKE